MPGTSFLLPAGRCVAQRYRNPDGIAVFVETVLRIGCAYAILKITTLFLWKMVNSDNLDDKSSQKMTVSLPEAECTFFGRIRC